MVRYTTLRTFLAHCAAEGMTILQLDIETAFLNGEVEEEIYVLQPKGYERGDTTKVCLLDCDARRRLHWRFADGS